MNAYYSHSPVPYFSSLSAALTAVGHCTVSSMHDVTLQSVSGGSINAASIACLTNNTQVFVKQNRIAALPLLKSELIGLQAIASTGACCAQPLAFGLDHELGCGFLLLTLIRSSSLSITQAAGWKDLAAQLVTLHRATPPQPVIVEPDVNTSERTAKDKSPVWQYGWFEDNFIGSLPQRNNWQTDWHQFFAEQRLGYQTKLALDNGRIDRQTLRQIEQLQGRLPDYLPAIARPSLLHGDLWSGNALIDDNNQGYLIDPAVYVGDPEADIAMTRLFGGFDTVFYEAYTEQLPLFPGFDERQDIYNLYHYLNHLNLFGSSYLGAVKRIAQHFGSSSLN